MKINPAQSEAPFQSLSMIRRSNTEALQYKRQIECNRITNDNQNISKTNEKHLKNYRSPRMPDGEPAVNRQPSFRRGDS